MNAAGLRLSIFTIDQVVNSPVWYDDLVKEGVAPDELLGTRKQLSYLDRAIKATPPEKLDEIVAQYDAQLTAHSDKFSGEWQQNRLAGFRDAQITIGYVTSIFDEAGIRP